MADLEKYTDPGFYIIPRDTIILGNGLLQVNEYVAVKVSEAIAAIVKDAQEYRNNIQVVGEGKYLRVREVTPSILDGEGEWNLPPSDADHVGEDTA